MRTPCADCVKCPNCGEISLFNDEDIGVNCENCDFESYPCPNDGKCIVIINPGLESISFQAFCKCGEQYQETDNQTTKDYISRLTTILKDEEIVIYIGYHPKWWESDGLSVDPFG